ncbi:MAG: bifunctional diaminohydroxyphosphoribosylaminopyrimidine deaminase/5-amino-6-(5-phosphoribosylamino)uracil reductase RibD [Cyanobacteria bacterium J06641_5]
MTDTPTDFDRQMMRRCLDLARRGAGKTAPNPMVGAVVVKDGEIVGEGFHPGPGQPHAEVFALKEAGDRARGATIYVSLEPCNHYGRTPPCTEAVINAGIAKVVIGLRDPNPKAAGGIERLHEHGIATLAGIEEAACKELNTAFLHRIFYNKPLGWLKYAMTLDGKIACSSGHSNWVTGTTARQWVHQLRGESDAVVIGGNTLRIDNPLMTTHGKSDRDPLRVVMSRSLDLPEGARLWKTDIASTLVCTQQGTRPEFQKFLLDKGVEVLELDDLTPTSVMAMLYERGCSQVLWECGGILAAEAIAAGTIQKIAAFIAPKIVGGSNAPGPVGDLGIMGMDTAIALEQLTLSQHDGDWLIVGDVPAAYWRSRLQSEKSKQ